MSKKDAFTAYSKKIYHSRRMIEHNWQSDLHAGVAATTCLPRVEHAPKVISTGQQAQEKQKHFYSSVSLGLLGSYLSPLCQRLKPRLLSRLLTRPHVIQDYATSIN